MATKDFDILKINQRPCFDDLLVVDDSPERDGYIRGIMEVHPNLTFGAGRGCLRQRPAFL